MIDGLLIGVIIVGGGAAMLLARRQPKLWREIMGNLKWELWPKALRWLRPRR